MRVFSKEKTLYVFYVFLAVTVSFFVFFMFQKTKYINADTLALVHFQTQTEQEKDGITEWTGHLNRDVPKGAGLLFYLYRNKVCIFQNGVQVYEEDARKVTDGLVEPAVTKWGGFVTDGIRKTDEIVIKMWPDEAKRGRQEGQLLLDNIYSGSRYELLQLKFRENSLKIFLSLIIIILGVAMLCVLQTMWFMKVPVESGYASCGLLLISGSICTFIDYRYVTLLFRNAYMVHLVDMLSQALIIEFLLAYLKGPLKKRKHILLADIQVGIWTIIVFVYIVLRAFQLSDGNQYVSVALVLAMIFIVVESYFVIREYLEDKEGRTKYMLFSGVLLTAFVLVEAIHYFYTGIFWIYIFQIGLILFTLIQFAILMRYTSRQLLQAEKTQQIENELMQNRIAIMISQIQPHFLYNTISGIQELCMIDANRASTALNHFGRFLRSNMNSLTTTELIPFSQELAHVKNYIYLQKMRFEEFLNVEYEIEIEDFLVPALSLQPLVENAIRYGIGDKEEGGTVFIRTWTDGQNNYIEVRDDGVGFEMDKDGNAVNADKGRQHVGMGNIRRRLRAQCNGTLVMKSILHTGTTALIMIPVNAKKTGGRAI